MGYTTPDINLAVPDIEVIIDCRIVIIILKMTVLSAVNSQTSNLDYHDLFLDDILRRTWFH
jgi:hypothetical protein